MRSDVADIDKKFDAEYEEMEELMANAFGGPGWRRSVCPPQVTPVVLIARWQRHSMKAEKRVGPYSPTDNGKSSMAMYTKRATLFAV